MTNVFRRYRQRRAETKQLKRQAELDSLAERLDAGYLPVHEPITSFEETVPPETPTTKKPEPVSDNDETTTDSLVQCKICARHKYKLVTNCGHLLCAHCYNSGLQAGSICPMCQAVITTRIVLFP